MKIGGAIAGIVAISAVVASVAACRQVAGIDDRTAADSCGATPERDASCAECLGISCCAELAACAAGPACARAQSCLATCAAGDERCRSACLDASGPQDEPLAKLLACRTNACASACPTACGSTPAPAAECATCIESACCAEEQACNASAACLVRRFRRATCAEATCRTTSDRRNPGGAEEDAVVEACRLSRCASQCASWACVRPSVAEASEGAHVNVSMLSSLTTAGVAGLRVRRCNAGDVECSVVADEQTTNAAGVASFDISIGAAGFTGWFEVTDPKAERPDVLVFPSSAIRGLRSIYVPSFTSDALKDVVASLGGPTDSVAATVLARARDCTGADGAGVKLALVPETPEATPFYLVRRLPTVAAPSSSTDAELAIAGFVGVPPVSLGLRGSWAATGGELFFVPVGLRRGSVTFVDFAPGSARRE